MEEQEKANTITSVTETLIPKLVILRSYFLLAFGHHRTQTTYLLLWEVCHVSQALCTTRISSIIQKKDKSTRDKRIKEDNKGIAWAIKKKKNMNLYHVTWVPSLYTLSVVFQTFIHGLSFPLDCDFLQLRQHLLSLLLSLAPNMEPDQIYRYFWFRVVIWKKINKPC